MSERKYNVAVVGATGLVGGTFLKVLKEYNFPIANLKLLASSRSAGKVIDYNGKEIIVEELTENSFKGVEIALFSAGGDVSRKFAPIAAESGAVVIDNSSAFRNFDHLPLVVPEVNAFDIKAEGIIANPNCSTIQAIIPVKALSDKYGLESIQYATYQAVSGSGMKGVNDLKNTLAGEENQFYPYPIAQTCIPEIDAFLDDGYTKEEMKMVNETRKMLHIPNLPISATCIRVPVPNCHGVLVHAQLKEEFNIDDIKELFANYPGLKLVDDIKNHGYPTATMANDNDLVYVGRIRKDLSVKNGVIFYTVADNIRKGAASNAVQIAEYIVKNKML